MTFSYLLDIPSSKVIRSGAENVKYKYIQCLSKVMERQTILEGLRCRSVDIAYTPAHNPFTLAVLLYSDPEALLVSVCIMLFPGDMVRAPATFDRLLERVGTYLRETK